MRHRIAAIVCAAVLAFPVGVKAADELYVGGESVGIEVRYDGVMITGTYAINLQGQLYDPKDHGIASGDMITAVNGTQIGSMEDLYAQISSFQNEINEIPVSIIRKDEPMDVTLTTVYSAKDQTFQSGLYVKDKITGVGTLTFYDPAHETFGALGHEIMDSDLKEIAEIESGTLYPADVTSLTPAQSNVAGEKHAQILYDQPTGTINENTKIGIYGTYDHIDPQALKLPWAKQSEAHTGKAEIYTVLSKDQVEKFTISITKLHHQDAMDVKGIEFTVDDPSLMKQTNGIIQGMSGSPIVQDGKIIGAITHVITSQPMNGYGVYIEWMLEEANN